MSNLYETVKNVINASSDNEAKAIFYSKDGIHVNNTEYIKNIISSFINKKEHVIKKDGNSLVFDLENYNDMWNIIFIGEYIKENDLLYKSYLELEKEIESINNELKIIIDKHKTVTSPEEHADISNEYNLKRVELNQKLAALRTLEKVRENFNSTDWVRLENNRDELDNLESIELLKQAINLIHKIRNSFEHTHTSYESKMEINNDGFNVKIPIEYINGFNTGRIISKEEDRIIVERTNTISSPILKVLGYNPLDIESFFYNMDPEFLDYLLKISDYDIKKLYKIPDFLLNSEALLKSFVSCGLSIDDIINIPYESNHSLFFNLLRYKSFSKFANTDPVKYISLNAKNIIKFSKYCTAHHIHFDEIPDYSLIDNIILLLEKGIEPSIIQILSPKSFNNPTSPYVDKELEIIKELKSLGMSMGYYQYPHNWIEDKELLLFYINEGYIKKDEFCINNFNTLRHINDSNREWLKYMKDHNVSLSQISLPMVHNTKVAIKLLNIGEDINVINKFITDSDFVFYSRSKKIISYLLSRGFTFRSYDHRLPNYILDTQFHSKTELTNLNENEIIHVLKMLNNNEITDSLLFRLMYTNRLKYKQLIFLIQMLRTIEIDLNKIRLEEFLFNPSSYINFLIKLNENDIHPKNIEILPDNLEDIGIGYFKDIHNLLNFLQERCGKVDKKIPSKLIVSYLQDKAVSMPFYATEQSDTLNIKYDNISYLLDFVDNDYSRLDEFPMEFFTCDIEILKEMVVRYNSNINKAIFGIDNCKIISILIYGNSVLSNYIKDNQDYNSVNISAPDIYNSSKMLTLEYSGISEEQYNNQFMFDLSNPDNFINSKRYLLDKLRNSFAHFRFKPVKDENGNICSDKILLYDTTDDYASRNFTIIFNLNDLIELIRSIEIDLNKIYSINDEQTTKQ